MSAFLLIFLTGQIWCLLIGAMLFAFARRRSFDPNIWLTAIITAIGPVFFSLIYTSFAPGAASSDLTVMSGIRNVVTPILSSDTAASFSFPFAAIYGVISIALVMRILWKWARLQIGSFEATPYEDVIVTDAELPPHALSWPRRKIVMSRAMWDGLSRPQRSWIIMHERSHILNRDPETTLGLLCLRDLFWINPAIHWLVSQWRMSAEIRADRAVIDGQSTDTRHAYASLLLEAMHNQKGESALPCPSAYLTSNRKRSVKMRLNEIMSGKPRTRKPVIRTVFVLGSLAAIVSGTQTLNAFAAPSQDQDAKPIKRVPPMMPASCPGLDISDIKTEKFSPNANQKFGEANFAIIGSVSVKFDVDMAGSPRNIEVTNSNHECFEKDSIDSVSKWTYSANSPKYGVETKIRYIMMEDEKEPGSLATDLAEFAKSNEK